MFLLTQLKMLEETGTVLRNWNSSMNMKGSQNNLLILRQFADIHLFFILLKTFYFSQDRFIQMFRIAQKLIPTSSHLASKRIKLKQFTLVTKVLFLKLTLKQLNFIDNLILFLDETCTIYYMHLSDSGTNPIEHSTCCLTVGKRLG
jgi:hypothetical protein